MNDDELKRSLESLFSDVAPPPATPEGAEVEKGPPEPEPPEEKPAALESEPSPEPTEPRPEIEVPGEALSPVPEGLIHWRTRLLRLLAYAAVILGFPAVALNVYDAYSNGQLVLIPFWLGSYFILLLITFAERLPYCVKAGTFLSLIYGFSLFDLIQSGHTGNNGILLLSIPVLAVTFLSPEAGIAASLVAFATEVVSAWAISANRFVPLGQEARWWSSPMVFLLIGSGLLLAQTRLIPHLTDALTRSRELGRNLADYQARLGGQKHELRRRALQLEAAVELGRDITSTFDVDDLLGQAVELIPDYFGCSFASIFLLDETGDRVVLRAGTGDVWAEMAAEGFQIEITENSIIGWTATHKVSYVALDVDKNERYQPHPLLPKTGSEVSLPLMFNGHLLGVLDVRARETMAFDETDIRVLRSIADQLAVAIQNARHTPDETALLEATSALYRASRRLTKATSTDDVTDAILDSVAETEADECLVVAFVQSPSGELDGLRYLSSWQGRGQPWPKPGAYVRLEESPFPVELMDGSWTVTDAQGDERVSRNGRRMLAEMGIEALVSIPLDAEEEHIGQIVVLSEEPRSFSASSMRLFEMLIDDAPAALERAQLLERIQRDAEQKERLRRVIDRIRKSADIEHALRAAAGELSGTMDVPRVSIELDLDVDDGGRPPETSRED
jgi:GAF domain-containing protein